MGLKETIKQLLTKKIESEYRKNLSEKKISYHDWVEKQEKGVQVSEVAEKSFREEYVILQQKKGKISENAERWMAAYIAAHPEVQILYGDEDFLNDQGERENPWYKPCWSPDTYLSQFYIGSVIAVKKSLMVSAQEQISSGMQQAGDAQADGAAKLLRDCEKHCNVIPFQDPASIRPLLTASICQAGGFGKGCNTIAGCGQILFHVTDVQVWDSYLTSSQKPEVGKVSGWTDFSDISVIIPSKDNPKVLEKCLKALDVCVKTQKSAAESAAFDVDKTENACKKSWKTSGPEIIVVDNGSSEENRKQIEELTQGMKYIYTPMEFNFSKMCKIGVEASCGKYLLFLNDDIEVCGREWLSAMKAKAMQPYVGAVGLKLYYPDSRRIQHAGITNLPVGPVHKMQYTEDTQSYYFDRNKADMNCLAVTAACLLIEREKYLEAGGLKESLRVAYNDVELGFALYESGYHNVVINTHYAYHHESLSRGNDETREKQLRLQKERERLYELHPALKDRDPYYPELLQKDGLDVRIVPGYISTLNTIQEAGLEKMCFAAEQVRVDGCLMLGLEVAENGIVRGYGVVIGDNNACYDRYIVLARMKETQAKSDEANIAKTAGEECPSAVNGNEPDLTGAWLIKTQPQYRQDLEVNIPDQKNVAMAGFHVNISDRELGKLEKGGQYAVGVLAVHKINKGKLLNWSRRCYLNE